MRKRYVLAITALVIPILACSSVASLAQQSETKSAESENQRRGYISAAPVNSMRAKVLIGARVRTSADEEVGTVNNLVINEKGNITAGVVGVDGLLGMSQKSVAVPWGKVKRSITADELELRIDVTPDDLGAAPTFETRE